MSVKQTQTQDNRYKIKFSLYDKSRYDSQSKFSCCLFQLDLSIRVFINLERKPENEYSMKSLKICAQNFDHCYFYVKYGFDIINLNSIYFIISISKKQILLKNKNYTLMNLGQRKPESSFKTPESCRRAVQFQRSPQTIKYFIGNGYEGKFKDDTNGKTKTSYNQKYENSSSSSSIKVQVKSPTFNKQFQYKNSKLYMNHRQNQDRQLKSVYPSLKKKYQEIKIDIGDQDFQKPYQGKSYLTKLEQMQSIIKQIENYQKSNVQSEKQFQQQDFINRQNRQNSIQNLYKRLERIERRQDNTDNSRNIMLKVQKQSKRISQIQTFEQEQKKHMSSLREQRQQIQTYYLKQIDNKDRKIETLKNINQRLQAEVFALQRSKIDLIKHNELLNECLKSTDNKRQNSTKLSGKNFQYRQIQELCSPKSQKPLYSKISEKDQRQTNYIKLLQQQLQQRQFEVTSLNIQLQKLQLKMNTFDEIQIKIKQEQSNRTKQQLSQLTLSYQRSIKILNQQIDDLRCQSNEKQTTIQSLKKLIVQKDKVIKEIYQIKTFVQEFKYEIVKKIKSETDLSNLVDMQVEESEIIQVIKKENLELKDKLFQMKKAELVYLQKIKHLDTDMKNSRILFLKDQLKSYEKQTKNNNLGLNRLASLQSHKLQLFKVKQRKIEQVNQFFQKTSQNIQYIIQRQKIPLQQEKKQQITYKCKFSLVSSEKSLSQDREV